MKNLITLLLIAIPIISFSQSWFQDGDQWVNRINSGLLDFNEGIEEIRVVSDTMISGNLHKVLSRRYAFEVNIS